MNKKYHKTAQVRKLKIAGKKVIFYSRFCRSKTAWIESSLYSRTFWRIFFF